MDHRIEQEWRNSRSGARAGSGFRFQDAAAAVAAVGCWNGSIDANALVPEGIDDFDLESAKGTLHVQVKSKVNYDGIFTAGEILNALGISVETELHPRRALIIDRQFVGKWNTSWKHPITTSAYWSETIERALSSRPTKFHSSLDGLREYTLITLADPIATAADMIAVKRNVSRAAALSCVYKLVKVIGDLADSNAQTATTFAQRAKLTTGEVDRYIDDVLKLIDLKSVDAASRAGLVEFVSFGQPLAEPTYYEGIATTAGHVAAGLVLARDELVDEAIEIAITTRRLLIVGPSGSGKSAVAYLAAYRTRHACRWVQIRRCAPEDRESLLHFIDSQAPDESAPIVLYVDDAGRGVGSEWAFACELTRSRAGLIAIATVRSEDVAMLSPLAECRQIRIELDEAFARQMWETLRSRSVCTWPFWKEPFEQARGLLLEYAHILTKGRRLRDVVADQVTRRLNEGRDAEFEILRLTSAAGSLGAGVSASRLAQHIGLGNAEFARALQRLIDEHLVRRTGEDSLGALHPLRAASAFETCQQLVPESRTHARAVALAVVNVDGIRHVIAGALRTGDLTVDDAAAAVADRLALDPDPAALAGALEGLKIATIDRDAALFNEIVQKYGMDVSQYSLILIVLNSELGSVSDSNAVFRAFGQIRKEFRERSAADLRPMLLSRVHDDVLRTAVTRIQSASALQQLLRALSGIELGERTQLLDTLSSVLRGAPIDEIASILATTYEISPTLVVTWVEALGGESSLLDRLWRETPWALRPNLANSAENEINADLLAVTGDLVDKPDSIVFDHASRALALAPSAVKVTSRPLPVTGDPLVVPTAVGPFEHGIKSIGRENSPSRAKVTWNRMLLHAASTKMASESLTSVMQRRKEALVLAARLLRHHADIHCRRKKPTARDRAELQALGLVERIAPQIPLERPELALGESQGRFRGDPADELVSQIVSACEHMHQLSTTRQSLVLDLQSIEETARRCQDDERWRYISAAPIDLLEDVRSIASGLGRVFLSGISLGGTGTLWKRGHALEQALERAEQSAHYQLQQLRRRLTRQLETAGVRVSVLGSHVRTAKRTHWPDMDICILIECDNLLKYAEWVGTLRSVLHTEAAKLESLIVAAVVQGHLVAQYAIRVYTFGMFVDEGFSRHWASISPYPMFTSVLVTALQDALDALLSLYAGQVLLQRTDLLPAELAYFEGCSNRYTDALGKLQAALNGPCQDAALGAREFLLETLHKIQPPEGSNEPSISAPDLAKRFLPGVESDEALSLHMHRVNLMETELEHAAAMRAIPARTISDAS